MISFSTCIEHVRAESKPVVTCLQHVWKRGHFRLGVSSFVGHCCQNVWVGWGPNRRRSCVCDKGRTSPWQMPAPQAGAANIFWSASAGRRWCCCVQWYQTPRPCCRAVERSCFGCARSVALVTTIKKMAGGACKCGVGSVVHPRKSDRSPSDAAVLCAGVSFSWARPTQQPNESWLFRRIW